MKSIIEEKPLFRFDTEEEKGTIEPFIVGVDPDVEKSGICIYWSKSNFKVGKMSFFDFFEFLVSNKSSIKSVYIECGFLNKSNWHKKQNGNAAVNSQIGQRTGANHETAKKLIEMCEYLRIKHFEIKPKKSKLDAETFKSITGYQKRTNQDERDAIMLVFGR